MQRSTNTSLSRIAPGNPALLTCTCKGAFISRADWSRRRRKLSAPMFLGHITQQP
jgi:hypothetical protein